MTYQVELLEKCLRAWEDYWFLLSCLTVAQQKSRKGLEFALAHSASFRVFLLEQNLKVGRTRSTEQSEQLLDIQRFMPPPELAAEIPSSFVQLPGLLAGWSLHSRRIYGLSEELQAVLQATSLKRMRWEDLSLPFPTFGIRLEEPFTDPDGEKFSLVFLHTCRTSAGETWMVQSFSDRCSKYQPLPLHVRQQLTKQLSRQRYGEVERSCGPLFQRFNAVGGYCFSLSPHDRGELVLRTVRRLTTSNDGNTNLSLERAARAFEQMLRVVVGFSLYLKALPPGSPHLSQWSTRHLPRSLDPRAVTKNSQICEVSSVYRLSPDERSLLVSAAAEHPERALSVHFRSAYWRRARGTAHDPLAPKVEHVRWTIVRLDRLPDNGALPQGTLQQLRSSACH